MNVVEIEHLCYTYPGADKPTLRDVDLTIEKGDFLAIVGNNGCGKSTLCKTLNGLIPQFITGEFSGRVRVCGLDAAGTDVGALARKVGYVYQDFENQIIRPTVLDDASYACLNYALPDYLDRGRQALAQCGLQGREADFIWQLSGGQTHLLALAGVLSLQPEVLILDEPIAQLDPQHADRIYGVLRTLNEQYGKTILVIEHHTEYIADYCKHVLLLKDGGVQWKLPTDDALQRVEELQGCNIFPPQVTIAAHRLRQAGELDAPRLPATVEEGRRVFARRPGAPARTPAPALPAGEPVVQFRNVAVSYRSVKGDPHTVYDGLDLTIRKGDKIALIGSNGAGKSTMMKLMVGLLKPDRGEVVLNGRDLRRAGPETLARQVSMVYQNPEDMFIKDSIEADIAYAMEVRGVPDARRRTEALLDRFRLTDLRGRAAAVGRADAPGQPGHRHRAGPGHPAAGRTHRQPGHCHPQGDHAHAGTDERDHRDGGDRHPRHAACLRMGRAGGGAQRRPGAGRRPPGPHLCRPGAAGRRRHPPARDLHDGAGAGPAGRLLHRRGVPA